MAPILYADIVPEDTKLPDSKRDEKPNFHGVHEFAVIAFWDLVDRDEKFQCSRFFIVPIPLKRTIQDSKGTTLAQVLY